VSRTLKNDKNRKIGPKKGSKLTQTGPKSSKNGKTSPVKPAQTHHTSLFVSHPSMPWKTHSHVYLLAATPKHRRYLPTRSLQYFRRESPPPSNSSNSITPDRSSVQSSHMRGRRLLHFRGLLHSTLQVAHEVEEIRRMVSLPYTNRLILAIPCLSHSRIRPA
jgi:hypothetical protein